MGRGEDSTRQAFADAYIKLQGANPESRISVKDISAAAGFDRHTFYYHFTGLQDLVSWIFDREFSRIMEDSDGSWEAVLLKFLEYADSNRALMLALTHSTKHMEIIVLLKRRIKDVMDLYLSLHQPFSQMPDDERCRISVFMAGGTVAVLREWFSSGMEKSSAETYAELRDIVGCCLSGFQRM